MDEAFPPPKSLGTERELTLTGMLFAVRNNDLVLLNMYGVTANIQYLALFSEPDQLQSVLARAGVPFTGIKQVEDGREFLDSVPPDLVIITDLRFTDEGKIRFTQVYGREVAP